MRLIRLLILAFAATPLFAHAQGLDRARSFVAGLYDRESRGQADYLGRDAPSVFSADLLRLIRRDQARTPKGDEATIDWDPICACQDPDGLKLVAVKLQPLGAGRARADVKIRFQDGGTAGVRLDLVGRDGVWRVSDVRTRDEPSIVALLRPHGR